MTSGKGATQAHSIKHPVTGHLIVNQDEIRKVSIQFCQEVLKKNDPEKDYKDIVEMKDIVHKKRMNEHIDKGFKAEKEVFDSVLDNFKRNGKRSYDFL